MDGYKLRERPASHLNKSEHGLALSVVRCLSLQIWHNQRGCSRNWKISRNPKMKDDSWQFLYAFSTCSYYSECISQSICMGRRDLITWQCCSVAHSGGKICPCFDPQANQRGSPRTCCTSASIAQTSGWPQTAGNNLGWRLCHLEITHWKINDLIFAFQVAGAW